MLHQNNWCHTEEAKQYLEAVEEKELCQYYVSDEIIVKPPEARCNSRWPTKRGSRFISPNNVEIDGIPRHVRSLFIESIEINSVTSK